MKELSNDFLNILRENQLEKGIRADCIFATNKILFQLIKMDELDVDFSDNKNLIGRISGINVMRYTEQKREDDIGKYRERFLRDIGREPNILLLGEK